MLQISGRPAKIGSHINVRVEKHGDADVTAIDLPLTFSVSEEELDVLLGAGAHDALFINGIVGQPAEPRLKGIKGIQLEGKLEGAEVGLLLGLAGEPSCLSGCSLAKVTLKPAVGGMSECSLSIQARPSPAVLAAISAHLNLEASLDLKVTGEKGEDENQEEMDV